MALVLEKEQAAFDLNACIDEVNQIDIHSIFTEYVESVSVTYPSPGHALYVSRPMTVYYTQGERLSLNQRYHQSIAKVEVNFNRVKNKTLRQKIRAIWMDREIVDGTDVIKETRREKPTTTDPELIAYVDKKIKQGLKKSLKRYADDLFNERFPEESLYNAYHYRPVLVFERSFTHYNNERSFYTSAASSVILGYLKDEIDKAMTFIKTKDDVKILLNLISSKSEDPEINPNWLARTLIDHGKVNLVNDALHEHHRIFNSFKDEFEDVFDIESLDNDYKEKLLCDLIQRKVNLSNRHEIQLVDTYKRILNPNQKRLVHIANPVDYRGDDLELFMRFDANHSKEHVNAFVVDVSEDALGMFIGALGHLVNSDDNLSKYINNDIWYTPASAQKIQTLATQIKGVVQTHTSDSTPLYTIDRYIAHIQSRIFKEEIDDNTLVVHHD